MAVSARLTILRGTLLFAPRPAPFVPHRRFDRGGDDRLDPAANVEITRHLHPPWSACGGEVVEDPVHRALVEDPVVAIAPEIELEALELEAEPVGHVVDEERPEIGSSARKLPDLLGIALDTTEWAQLREFRTLHADGVVPIGVRVLEGLE